MDILSKDELAQKIHLMLFEYKGKNGLEIIRKELDSGRDNMSIANAICECLDIEKRFNRSSIYGLINHHL